MLRVKRVIGMTILISAIMFPASAFASNGSDSGGNNNSQQSSFSQFLSFFLGYSSQQNNSVRNQGNNNDDKEYEAWCKEWEKKNKEYCPPKESYNIWKNWFCY